MQYTLLRIRKGEKMSNLNKQTEANKRWQEKNRDRSKYLRNRSTSRSFIRNQSTLEDLTELEQLISERKKEL